MMARARRSFPALALVAGLLGCGDSPAAQPGVKDADDATLAAVPVKDELVRLDIPTYDGSGQSALAPARFAISCVPSVLPESTTTISPAPAIDSRHRDKLSASLCVRTTMASESGISVHIE